MTCEKKINIGPHFSSRPTRGIPASLRYAGMPLCFYRNNVTPPTRFEVDVSNVDPTATLGNNGPVAEDSTADVSFSNQFDPSAADTSAGFHYAYDYGNDGSFEVGDGTYGGSPTNDVQTVPANLLDDGPGSLEVRGRIIDKDGGFTDYTTTIMIENIAPSMNIVGPITTNEGQTKSYSFTTSDPGDDTFTLLHQSCGAYGTLSNPAFDGVTGAGSFDCAFEDGPAVSNVSVLVADSDGANAPQSDQAFQPASPNVTSEIRGSNVGAGLTNIAQTFTAGVSGTLTHVSALLRRITSGGLIFDVRATSGGAPLEDDNSVLASLIIPDGAVSTSFEVFTIDITSFNVQISAGDVLAFALRPGSPSSYYQADGEGVIPVGPYPGGASYIRSPSFPSWTLSERVDLWFQTFVSESEVELLPVNIANVAPVVTLSGPTSTGDGQTESYTYSTSDPGDETFGIASQSCGANGILSNPAFDSTNGSGSFDCTFNSAPATSDVSVQLSDSDGANSNVDTLSVSILVPPDLLGFFFSVPDPPIAGAVFDAQYQLRNDGQEAAGAFDVDFYVSTDTAISTSDTFLGRRAFAGLAGLTTTAIQNESLTLPPQGDPFWQTLGSAEYTIGMIVDADNDVGETDETNNHNQGDGIDLQTNVLINVKDPGCSYVDGNSNGRYEPGFDVLLCGTEVTDGVFDTRKTEGAYTARIVGAGLVITASTNGGAGVSIEQPLFCNFC